MYIPRAKKASRKYRGTRSCGWGRVAQHRRSGRKGGRGRAGMHKHKWAYTIKYAKNHFGKHGFQRPPKVVWRHPSINVGQLEELVAKLERMGRLELMEGIPFLDGPKLGFLKVLGSGSLTKPVVVRALSFTKRAAEKIAEAGGQVVTMS